MGTEIIDVSKFLEWFSPISLQYKVPEKYSCKPWVFWRQNEGSEINNNSSAAAADLEIHDKIKSVFYNIEAYRGAFFGQFWAPVTTIGGRQLLSASGQPFAVWDDLSNEMSKYRLYTDKYKYNIDINYNDKPADIEEEDHMIISGGPATAFLNRLPYLSQLQRIQAESSFTFGMILNVSFMLPICLSSQSSCIGVLEFIFHLDTYNLGYMVLKTIMAIKEAGLDVIPVQDLIPYTNINGIKLAKEEIKEALKVVCESHNLALAQVWIPYADKSRVLSSISLEDTQTKRSLAVKLTGYRNALEQNRYFWFDEYFRLCDLNPQGITEEFARETLVDYKSRYFSKFQSDTVVDYNSGDYRTCALTICLRSTDTGDFDYVFEFVWNKKSNYVKLLKAIILALKTCLPRFKFASGVALGNELDVICAQSDTQRKIFKIFQGKRSPKPKVPSNLVCKTTPKVLSREVIQKQFGNTMKEAAENLNVSLSTLKRKLKELGITEWPGPGFLKRQAKDLSINQIDTNEEDNGVIQEPSTINIDQNTLTIKAEHLDDMIKFQLPISQATFVTIEQKIGMKLKLSVGSYKLKYLDEDGDWILLTSDEDMHDCIKSSRKAHRSVVKIRVLPTPQPLSGPSGLFGV